MPRTALLLATLAGFGQAQAPLGETRAPSPSWFIINAINSVPGDNLQQVHHVKLPGNPPGQWTSGLTCGGLWAASPFATLGGDYSSIGIAIGTVDPYNATFFVNGEAQNLNSSDDEMHLTLSPDGLWAMYERFDSAGTLLAVLISGRSALGTNFPPGTPVSGFSGPGPFYPALGQVDGVWKCFYSDGQDIVMQDIDRAGAALQGAPQVVHRPVQPGAIAISPTPLTGTDGDVEAIWCADMLAPRQRSGSGFVVGSGHADPVWANDLRPGTAGVVQVQNGDWQCCGGVAGGFVNFTHNVAPAQHIMHSEAAWLLGDTEARGGILNMDVGARHASAPNPMFAIALVAAAEGPLLPVQGFIGQFGLGIGLVPFTIPLGATTTLNGTINFSFPIPPGVAAGSLVAQAVVVDTTISAFILTNTAWLHIL
ncbi:MAG: hypothetical protein AAF628_15510 [Planctomycetota bacterium]